VSGRKEPSGHQPCPYFPPWARVSSTNQTGQTGISRLAHCFPASVLKAGPEVPTVGRQQGQSSWNAPTTVLKQWSGSEETTQRQLLFPDPSGMRTMLRCEKQSTINAEQKLPVGESAEHRKALQMSPSSRCKPVTS